MNSKFIGKYRNITLFLVVFIFCCLPIWFVDRYINQDGSPHLYNSFLLLELLKGNNTFVELYSINPYPIPNLSGHWLMAFLLLFLSSGFVSKLMVTITFGGLVAASGWLRRQTSEAVEGINLSFLLGTVFAFNWLWFMGFYNFILGLIGFTFGVGLFWKWRESLNFKKSLILFLLVIFVYFSHLISFGMFLWSVLIISLISITRERKKNYFWAAVAFIPSIPLIIGYKLSTESGGSIVPTWRYLNNPFSIAEWTLQLQAADPYQLISKRAFPFSSGESAAYSVFTPFLWLLLVIILLSAGTWIYRRKSNFDLREKLPWIILTISSIIFWVFSPDDFGKSHGGFLRERVLLCGLVCFIPVFEIGKLKWLKIISNIILAGIIIFQTAVLWEYALMANEIGRNYLTAKPYLLEDDKLGTIVFIENGCRYKSSPLTNLTPILGIGKHTRIWDNYELGYYLFPVIVNNQDERNFIFEYRASNSLDICRGPAEISLQLANLQTTFERHHQKFTVLLVWNGNQSLEPIISKWFEVEPFFQNDNVKLYRHK